MKILIISPLFPPDTTPSAQYVKELAARLTNHEVTLLLYGHLPEMVPNVQYVCVDKRNSIFRRTLLFINHLVKLARQHDIIIIQNGPSVELPCLLALWFTKVPVILMESDVPALNRTLNHWLYRIVHHRLQHRTFVTLSKSSHSWPLPRPQVHPLKPFPTEDIQLYENSWQAHVKELQSLLTSHHV